MALHKTAADYLKPLALNFAANKEITEKELHKNRHWKKIVQLPNSEHYPIVVIALRGLVQMRDPGFKNGLWQKILDHDLNYLLKKGNKQFLYEVADELKKARDINTLPFHICLRIAQSLSEHEFESCLSVLLDFFYRKYRQKVHPSVVFTEFVSTLRQSYQVTDDFEEADILKEFNPLGNYEEYKPLATNWGKLFVDSDDTEKAWRKLDSTTKHIVQQYEEDLAYDRSPKPSQQQKNKTIEAVRNSNLKTKHKKALIQNIKKKG